MAGDAALYDVNVFWDFPFTTVTDFTNDQFCFAALLSTGYVALASSSGALVLGVIQDTPVGTAAQPTATQIRTGGPTKVQAGGTFSIGQLVSSNSSGQAVLYTGATIYTGTPYTVSGTQVLGIAQEPGSAGGGLTSILFRPSGLVAAGD